MRKFILLLITLLMVNTVYAFEVKKNEDYYKNQIQQERFLYNVTGLADAIQKNNPEVVDMFMKAGFDPNSTLAGTPMLIFDIYKNKQECAKVLLDAGANPEVSVPPMFASLRSINALSYSINKGSSEIVSALIEHNVDVNKTWNGKTPLNRAIEKKQVKIVEYLLKAGAKPDKKTWKLVEKSKDEYLRDLFKNIER